MSALLEYTQNIYVDTTFSYGVESICLVTDPALYIELICYYRYDTNKTRNEEICLKIFCKHFVQNYAERYKTLTEIRYIILEYLSIFLKLKLSDNIEVFFHFM